MCPDDPLGSHARRPSVLAAMGFASYEAYLLSPLWKALRASTMGRARWRCKLCHGKAIDVHHLDYEDATMRGRNMASLVALCRACHKWVEFGGKERWDPAGAMDRYLALLHAPTVVLAPRPSKAPLQKSMPCHYCGGVWQRHKFRHDRAGVMEMPLICPRCAGRRGAQKTGPTKKQLKRAAFRARKAQEMENHRLKLDRKYVPRPH